MDEKTAAEEAGQVKKILEQNFKLTEEIYKQTKYIKNYVFWAQIAGVIKILLIVIPIVVGIIYLPPLLKGVFDQYKNLFGVQAGEINPLESLLNGGAGNIDLKNFDMNKINSLLNQ